MLGSGVEVGEIAAVLENRSVQAEFLIDVGVDCSRWVSTRNKISCSSVRF